MSTRHKFRTASRSLRLEARDESLVNQISNGSVSDGIPAEVHTLVLDFGRDRLVLVSLDVVWLGNKLAADIRREIGRRANCVEARICIAASHTHGSPQPEPDFNLGQPTESFRHHLAETVLECVDLALSAQPRSVMIEFARDLVEPPLAVNRRRRALYRNGLRLKNRTQSLPNFASAADNSVTIVSLREPNGQVPALIVHFACHPVCDPYGTRGADYPGVMRRELRRALGNDVAIMFLQGFCGDVRPRLIHEPVSIKDKFLHVVIGPRFRKSTPNDTEKFGHLLAEICLRLIDNAIPTYSPSCDAMSVTHPIESVSGSPMGRSLQIVAWKLADNCRLVFANAEMLSGLAPDDGVISVAYTNGMVGYVAPASEYARGGYEIDGFLSRFGLSERVHPNTGAEYLVARNVLLTNIAKCTDKAKA